MKSIVNRNDMALADKIFKYTSPQKLPISFVYRGERVCGIPESYSPVAERKLVDANITEYTVKGTAPDGLEVCVEYSEYRDYPVTELTAFFTNTGDTDTDIISDIRIIDGTIEGQNPVFIHGNGDTCGYDGYEWYRDELSEEKIRIMPRDGTSCNGAFPYMRLMFDGFGVNIAVGWPAMWYAELSGVTGGAAIGIGQKRCSFKIHPGETMRTPRVNLEAFAGDEIRGIQMWRRWYLDHILPRENGKPLPPKYCMHVYMPNGKPEFTDADEKNQVDGIYDYLSHGVHPDIWWIDAGWYPCDYDWGRTGTWYPDPKRFPNGLGPIGRACDENGIQLLLWFEPERVRTGTELEVNHPEWLLRCSHGDSLLNLGCRECCDYIIEAVDKVIKEGHVSVYRQDFNMNPEGNWVENEAEDRIGALENLHVQGYLRYWDALIARNPGLWIDSCASGGRRNDLETMRRAVPLHYTDVGYGDHPVKQKQHREMFEWIPYFRAHNQCWDNPETGEYNIARDPDRYSYHVAFVPSMTDITEHDAPEEAFELAREMKPIWNRAAEIMLNADYYTLTECRKSREDFYAVQFHNPDTDSGYVQVVSNNANPCTVFEAKLYALNPDSVYVFADPEHGESFELSGNAFKAELERRTGKIWFYSKK